MKKRSARELTTRIPILPGTSPGTIHTVPEAEKPVVTVIGYGPDTIEERRIGNLEELREIRTRFPITWVNVEGLGDPATISHLGEIFHLHRLALEDVTDLRQRAKVEEYPEHVFFIMRMTTLVSELETEQLAIFLGTGFVLTFQETVGDCFDPVRERLRKARGRLRTCGPDYLTYALLDAIIDNYFPVLETYGELLENLEDDIIIRPEPRMISTIHGLKRDLLAMRRSVWPLREAINTMVRDATPRFTDETRLYLRDCYDHTIQIVDIIETYRDVSTQLMETYLSSVSNRMNDIMKVLTIISTIFIPLSFVAGVYGMNFKSMPEIDWPYGYPMALGIMLLMAAGFLVFFWKRGWLRVLSPQPIQKPSTGTGKKRGS